MSKTIYFKNAKEINGESISILVKDNLITEVFRGKENLPNENNEYEVIDLKNETFVSPGWIDIHTHANEKLKPYGDQPDSIGIQQGVTTIFDAGSVGIEELDEFYDYTQKFKTEVFSLLNLSKKGISNNIAENAEGELMTSEFFTSSEEMKSAINKYPDFIKGMKVRISNSVSGNNGIPAIEAANKLNKEFDFRTLMHIGSTPPDIVDILNIINNNFVITHAFNGKDNNPFKSKESIEILKNKINDGVKLDVGHGSASFSKNTFETSAKNNISADIISTDIYITNREEGPVYSLALVASKCLSLNMGLEEVINAITINPAKIFGLNNRTSIEKGMSSNLTFFNVEDKKINVVDSNNINWTINKVVKPIFTHINGGVTHVKESNLWKI